MKEVQSKIESVIVSAEESLAMRADDTLRIIMTTPLPWTDNRDVLVSFWRKSSPPLWVKAA